MTWKKKTNILGLGYLVLHLNEMWIIWDHIWKKIWTKNLYKQKASNQSD